MSPGTRENTIIMFIGDNGSPNQVARDVYGIHDAKGTIYEGGTHVPFVVTGPGIAAGQTDALMHTTDLFATIASLTGAQAQTPDSADFSPVLSGGEGSRTHVYIEHFSEEPPERSDVFGWALRDERYKLVVPEGVDPELYDLATDPLEQTNLLAGGGDTEAQTIVERLQALRPELAAN